jgi:hypothetical protein
VETQYHLSDNFQEAQVLGGGGGYQHNTIKIPSIPTVAEFFSFRYLKVSIYYKQIYNGIDSALHGTEKFSQ